MSLPKRMTAPFSRRFLVATLLVAASAGLSACQVRPLYSDSPVTSSTGVTTSMKAELASIAIKPSPRREDTRFAQEVRTHLIYLFGNGKGPAATPAYTLELDVRRRIETAAIVQITSDDDEPSAGTLELTGRYRLTETATGKRVASGSRMARASFDRPRQEFAVRRATIDAENRAARELADFLRLSVAQDLLRKNRSTPDTFEQEEIDPELVIQPKPQSGNPDLLPAQ